jgi:amino acid transporter
MYFINLNLNLFYIFKRIVYSMGYDGLIFKAFAKVLPKFKTPVVSIVVTGLLSGKK